MLLLWSLKSLHWGMCRLLCEALALTAPYNSLKLLEGSLPLWLAVWGLRMKGALSEYSLMAPAAALLLRVQSLGNTLFLQGFQALALPPEGAMGNRYLQRLRMDSLPLPAAVRTTGCLIRKVNLMAFYMAMD